MASSPSLGSTTRRDEKGGDDGRHGAWSVREVSQPPPQQVRLPATPEQPHSFSVLVQPLGSSESRGYLLCRSEPDSGEARVVRLLFVLYLTEQPGGKHEARGPRVCTLVLTIS